MSRSYALLAAGVILQFTFCYGQVNQTAQTGALAPQSPCFSISAVPPTNAVRFGESVSVQVTVKNISGKDIYWSYAKTNTLYKAFSVRLEKDGREAETTLFHRKMTGKLRPEDPQEVEGSDSVALPLVAGASFTWTLDIKNLYNIAQPGVYTLTISRFDDCSKAVVHSKPVLLDIVP